MGNIQAKGIYPDMRPLVCFDYDDVLEITGGWSGADSVSDNVYINVGHSSTQDRRQSSFSLQPIDVTKYKTLEIIVSKDSSPPWDGQSCGLYRSRSYSSSHVNVSMNGSNSVSMGTFVLDISAYTGLYYPGLSVYVSMSSDSGNWIRLYSFKLLK